MAAIIDFVHEVAIKNSLQSKMVGKHIKLNLDLAGLPI